MYTLYRLYTELFNKECLSWTFLRLFMALLVKNPFRDISGVSSLGNEVMAIIFQPKVAPQRHFCRHFWRYFQKRSQFIKTLSCLIILTLNLGLPLPLKMVDLDKTNNTIWKLRKNSTMSSELIILLVILIFASLHQIYHFIPSKISLNHLTPPWAAAAAALEA